MMQHTRSASYQPMLVPTVSHTRRPSEPMPSWLSRSPTPSPLSPKPVKISEPKAARPIDLVSSPSTRLGLGATIVRTPDDALRDTGVRITYQAEKTLKHKLRSNSKRSVPLSPPTSPPLPPLPLPEDDEERHLDGHSPISSPRPSRSIPSDLQRTPSLSKRSSLKFPKAISVTHSSSSSSEDPPSVPPLPSHVAASTQPPPFCPVLITDPSSRSAPLSPENVIITLETCTQIYRTTLSTLTSRQSHLAKYLSAFYPPPPSPNTVAPSVSTSSSLYSTQTDDPGAVYRHHLSSHPVVSLTSTVHIFLDRPSAPYVHILSYLRQPFIDSQPESLPYALQLHNYTSATIQASSPSILQSKLDTLIEVRDEAAYLNLDGLHKLCVEEIKNRYNSKPQFMMLMQGQGHGQHIRGLSSSSMQSLHSLQASVYNLHPLQEKAEDASPVSDIVLNSNSTSSTSQPTPSPFPSSPAAIAIRRSKQGLAPSSENIPLVSRTPPTPQSFEGRDGQDQPQQQQLSKSQSQSNRSRSSSRSRPSHTHTPPTGWI